MSRALPFPASFGLLVLRIGCGVPLFAFHGLAKLEKAWAVLGGAEAAFPDPLGLGAKPSLLLAAFAEGICSLLVAAGFLTRLACLPVVTTMAVAAFVHHGADPWPAREPALLYLAPFAALLFAGPGSLSLDGLRTARADTAA